MSHPEINPDDECLNDLAYMNVITHACGHHVEMHCSIPVFPQHLAMAAQRPCVWCYYADPETDAPEVVKAQVAEQTHVHVPYRLPQGEFHAAWRRSPISPEDWGWVVPLIAEATAAASQPEGSTNA